MAKKTAIKKKSNTNNGTNCLSLLKSLTSSRVFMNKISEKSMLIYNLIVLLILTIVVVVSNNIENVTNYSGVQLGIFMFFFVPFLILVLYGMFYVFLNAFESKRKPFLENILVVSTFTIPFMILGNLLTLIDKLWGNYYYSLALIYIFFVMFAYYVMLFVRNIRNYYRTSAYKIITSIMLIVLLFLFLYVIEYLSYLIGNLK